MKRQILSLIIAIFFVMQVSIGENPSDVKILSYVNDYGKVFSAEETAILTSALKNIQDSQTAEVSIVTVKTLGGYDSQSFAQAISDGKLGDAEKNNGLLLLIAVEDRKYWFNVGRGLEPIFNDAKVGRIGREVLVPYFKESRYYDGSLSAINEIAKELNIELTQKVVPAPVTRQVYFNPMWIFIGVFFTMSIFRSFAAKNQGKHGRKRRNNTGLFMAAMFASSMMRGGGRGGFGGGGFGGGSFGGGGAGGGW